MKILLAACNAKIYHSIWLSLTPKACAKEYDSNVVLREYTINQQKDDILKDIYRCHPDAICISCYIWNITFVQGTDAGSEKDPAGCSFLGRRPGGIV